MHKSIFFYTLLVLIMMLSFACGDDDDDDSSTDDDDDDNDDGDDDNDSGDDDDTGGDDDTADDDTADLWGGLHVSEGYSSVSYKGWTYYNSVSTSFYDPDDAGTWAEPVEESGDCMRYYYEYPSTIEYYYYNGGTVTVSGANVSPIHLTPTAYQYGYYYEDDYDPASVGNLFDSGDAISFSTGGHGDIPAFSGSLNAPMMIEVTQPANFATLTNLPSSSMTFAWEAGSADSVSVIVSTMATDYDTMTIVCTADDGDGSLTIPGSLMEDLYDNPYSLTASVSRYRRTRTTADGKDFDFSIMTGRTRSVVFIDE